MHEGSRALNHLLRTAGGFTIDHETGRPLSRGIAVCADPELTWSFPLHDWDDHDVSAWVTALQCRLAEGDVHIGGWLEGDISQVWLELVWVFPERLRPAAIAIGRSHGQHAVFDLRRAQLVLLGGRVRDNADGDGSR